MSKNLPISRSEREIFYSVILEKSGNRQCKNDYALFQKINGHVDLEATYPSRIHITFGGTSIWS